MLNRKGFTLIELLIVVVIIGILAAIAIPKFANTKQKAVRSGMISDLRNLATAQEAFYADSTRYAGSYSSTLGSNSVNFSEPRCSSAVRPRASAANEVSTAAMPFSPVPTTVRSHQEDAVAAAARSIGRLDTGSPSAAFICW